MRVSKPLKVAGLALISLLALAGCKSAEERAEEHYQSGLALIADGDYDRAIVELRNVFQLNGSHQQARHKLAELLLEQRDNRQGAYSQYLRLVEQYPDDLDARIILSEIAFEAGNWEELDRHGTKAAELAPDNPRVQAISIARAYRKAAMGDDQSALREEVRKAGALIEDLPDSIILRNIAIDGYLRDGEFKKALGEIDWLLERDPDNLHLWRQRLNVLAQLDDVPALEAQLREMVTRFPDDLNNKQMLIRFFLSRDETDKAEGFLRELAAAEPDEVGPTADLIRFLREVRSLEAAQVEVDKAIAERADPVPFQMIGAGFDFEAGKREEAVAALEGVLSGAEPSEQTRNIKVMLAQMLMQMNNNVGARAQVEEVLAEDSSHVQALKMQAAWLIEGDDTDGAIAALRVALDKAPEDARAMTLMSQAYTRAGRTELARDFLALAVEASGNAPAETIRYARLLIEEERYLAAEDLLLPALRLAPENVDILLTLGQLYLGMKDLGRAEQVVQTLRNLEDPRAQQAANGLEAERLNQQSGPEEAMAYLESIAGSADATLASKISLVRARIGTGDSEGALAMARDLVAENPDNTALKAMLATTEAVNGNLDQAEGLYRELLELTPKVPGLWLELSRLKLRQGDPEAADAVIEEAIAQIPDDPNMLWAKASNLERDGDIDGALEIYEDLYKRNSGTVVVANNLASLLSTYRDDAESLNRAWTVARRFRDTDVPAMQDTYGWIEHRRGNSADALPYLEAAVKGLPGDPLVQYHLGKIYQALERPKDALVHFTRSADIAGPADRRPQIEDARAQIKALQATAEAAETDANQ